MDFRRTIRALLGADPLDSCIDSNEQVVFFPTVASFDNGIWRLPVHGWIYRPAELSRLRRVGLWMVRRFLARHVRTDAAGMAFFKQRAGAFLADNERWERMQIRLGDKIFRLKRSRADGHFQGQLDITLADAARLLSPPDTPTCADSGQWLSFRAITRTHDDRIFDGRVLLLPPTGLSVISDIDDTIKITHVRQRRKMLRRTFLEEFASVPDMAAVYQHWSQRGAAFHYVSASPWHLFPFLAEFLQKNGFPPGSFHLRDFRLMPGNLHRSLRPSRRIKLAHARQLMQRFPQRRFILVGDSGESDAAIYARLYMDYPHQVERICIRNVADADASTAGWEKTFKNLPKDRWCVFTNPQDLSR